MVIQRKHKQFAAAAGASLVCLALLSLLRSEPVSVVNQTLDIECSNCMSTGATVDQSTLKMAQRIQKRIRAEGDEISLHEISTALERRASLLHRTVDITTYDAGQTVAPTTWSFSVDQHTDLLKFSKHWNGVRFGIDEDLLVQKLQEGAFSGSTVVRDTHLSLDTLRTENKILRADNLAIAKDGYEYDLEKLSKDILQALDDGSNHISTYAMYRKPKVTVEDENGERELTLLSSGMSNYDESPEAREHNVRKAINEQVNNVVVEPKAVFSFNGTLNAPVTVQKGWKEALGLFGGGAAMTPGGGICQAASTVYRAIVLAGLPIVEKRNHSLYVSHYEQYGVGVDATIFPGVHDLRFKNESDEYMLIQAYTDGYDVYVNIYGKDDGRRVTMDGPYFATTKPRNPALPPIGTHQIGWVQTITFADGTTKVKPLVSHYSKPVPRNLANIYLPQSYIGSMHASAPEQVANVSAE